MSLCKTCQDRICEKSGRPCKEAEKEMRKEGIYSRDYIRPQLSSNMDRTKWGKIREIPMSNLRKEDKRGVEKELDKGYWSD